MKKPKKIKFSSMKKSVKLMVNGEEIKVPFSSLKIIDIDKSMSKISAQMAYWGMILAVAEQEKYLAESHYRAWRGREGKAIGDSQKLPEWKVNQILNSDLLFLQLKEKIAQAEFNVSVLLKFYDALKANAFILPSKGARARSEMSSHGMTTKTKQGV